MDTEKQAPSGIARGESWTVATGQAARWIGLELDLRAPRTWFGPSWALLGGTLGSGAPFYELRSAVLLAVTWLVAEPLLGSLVAVSIGIAGWRRECDSAPLAPAHWSLPYIQPGSPGRRLLDALAARHARLRWALAAAGENAPRWALLAVVALALGAAIGEWAVALVGLAVLALLWVAGTRPLRGAEREVLGATHLSLAWLLGWAAFAGIDYRALLAGGCLGSIWYAWTRRPPYIHLLAAAHVVLAGLLAALRAPISAVGVLLLAAPVFALIPESPSHQRSYLQHTQVYLMASLLLAAWGLAWGF